MKHKPSWNVTTNGGNGSEVPAKEPTTPPKTKACECGGTRTLRKGVSKGKQWAAWFCDNPTCKPEWVNLSSK